jgi:hypothetical protein
MVFIHVVMTMKSEAMESVFGISIQGVQFTNESCVLSGPILDSAFVALMVSALWGIGNRLNIGLADRDDVIHGPYPW